MDGFGLEVTWAATWDIVCARHPVSRKSRPLGNRSVWHRAIYGIPLILASTADLLWSLGQRCFPGMMSRLESFSASIGTEGEEENLDALYRELSRSDFSSDILETFPDKIAVVELKGVLWSDWGRRDRVLESLGAIGRLAPMLSVAATA